MANYGTKHEFTPDEQTAAFYTSAAVDRLLEAVDRIFRGDVTRYTLELTYGHLVGGAIADLLEDRAARDEAYRAAGAIAVAQAIGNAAIPGFVFNPATGGYTPSDEAVSRYIAGDMDSREAAEFAFVYAHGHRSSEPCWGDD